MANDKQKVRQILDSVKAAGRDSLTAPEGKLVCDAYGISVPKEGVATSAAEAQKLASSMGFPVVMKIVSPDILHKTEAGGVLVGVKSADEATKRLRHDPRQREEVQGRRQHRRRPGPADDPGRPGGHRRRGHRRQLRQAGRVRPRRRAGRGAEGHHVPPRAGDARGCAVDARRHPGRRDAEGRARQRPGQPRRARDADRAGQPARQRLPRDRRDGPEPGVREQERRDRRRRPHRRRLRREDAALPPGRGRRAGEHEAHHAAEGGRGDRRLRRGRQDRQLGDEEPDQRRLQGRRSTRSTRRPTRSWATRPTRA